VALELQQPPIINLAPNVGTVTLSAVPPTLSFSSPNPATDGGVAAYVSDAGSATRTALSAAFVSRKTQFRTFEDYSAVSLVSGVTNCKTAIDAALADTANVGVPIRVLGKTYLTTGGHVIPSYTKIDGVQGPGSRTGGSLIKLISGNDVNLFQSASWGDPVAVDTGIVMQDICLDGGIGSQTTVGVYPQAYLMVDAALSGSPATVTVNDTTGFAASGYAWVGMTLVAYTGKTGTTLTGCTLAGGAAAATMKTNAWVTPLASAGHCLALQASLSSFTNVAMTFARGSNLMIQGTPTNIAYQNSGLNLQLGTSNRFALEIGEWASDNTFVAPVLGDHNGRGQALIRANNTNFVAPHLVGSMSAQDASVIVAANQFAMSEPTFDTIPHAAIRFDTALRGGIAIADPVVTDIKNIYQNASAASRTAFLVGSGTKTVTRGKITGHPGNSTAPLYYNGYRNGPIAQLLGTQNPTTLSLSNAGSGLLQVDSVSEFPAAPTASQTVTISADVCTYTGRTKALNRVAVAASSGATSLTITLQYVPGTAAFVTGAGTILVGGGTAQMSPALKVTYTSFDPTTGIFSGCSGITADIPVSAYVSQHFLTGLDGATSGTSRADGTQISMTNTGFLLVGTKLDLEWGNTTSSQISDNLSDRLVFSSWSDKSGFGYPATADPVLTSGTYTSAANQARYMRVRDGGTISKVRLNIVTSSGNICIAVYRNSGSGLSAVPGSLVVSSGSVASPGTGDQDISLGSTIAVYPGDWIGISADNGTVQFASTANASAATTLGSGRHYQQTTAFPLPSTPSSLTAMKGTAPVLIGVP
jgi:hypothetical protein